MHFLLFARYCSFFEGKGVYVSGLFKELVLRHIPDRFNAFMAFGSASDCFKDLFIAFEKAPDCCQEYRFTVCSIWECYGLFQ